MATASAKPIHVAPNVRRIRMAGKPTLRAPTQKGYSPGHKEMRSFSRNRTSMRASSASRTLAVVHAIAAPMIPKRGARSKIRKTVTNTTISLFNAARPLRPLISNTECTFPAKSVARAPAHITIRADAPTVNSGPITERATGPKIASKINTGVLNRTSQIVAVW